MVSYYNLAFSIATTNLFVICWGKRKKKGKYRETLVTWRVVWFRSGFCFTLSCCEWCFFYWPAKYQLWPFRYELGQWTTKEIGGSTKDNKVHTAEVDFTIVAAVNMVWGKGIRIIWMMIEENFVGLILLVLFGWLAP